MLLQVGADSDLLAGSRDVITDTVYRRQKHPFFSPPGSSGAPSRMATLIQDTLRSKVVDSVPFLDSGAVRSLADRLGNMTPAERGTMDPGLMILISQIFLHERFVKDSPA